MPEYENAALERAIKKLGGPSAFAKRIGKSRQTVHDWRVKGECSAYDMVQIEDLTGIQAQLLCPSAWPESGW